jgi:uncharacterized tellurite resistance protein B-like protein
MDDTTNDRARVAHMIALAKSDGELDQREVMIIYGVAHKCGITNEEMSDIIADTGQIETPPFKSKQERIRFFYQMLILAVADDHIADHEKEFLKKIGDSMELAPDKVVSVMRYYSDHGELDLDDGVLSTLI